jgi:hypothetical protein
MTDQPVDDRAEPSFAHASEAEMARILDFYDVRWQYEPDTFPILWNLDGDVIESFSPDFWLPDLGLYLELTTLKQRLVRKKNRKLRRLRELYPDIRIKLFYARDFRALMLKYGKLEGLGALSGTAGQMGLAALMPVDESIIEVEPEQRPTRVARHAVPRGIEAPVPVPSGAVPAPAVPVAAVPGAAVPAAFSADAAADPVDAPVAVRPSSSARRRARRRAARRTRSTPSVVEQHG